MNRLTNLTPAEKNFLMMLLPQLKSVRQKAKSAEPAYRPEQSACAGESQRYADRQRALREDERQQSSLPGHVRAAPLIAPFGGLVVLTLRNCPLFTPVNSHATRRNHQERFQGLVR